MSVSIKHGMVLVVCGFLLVPRAEAVVLDVVTDAYIEDFSSSGTLDGIPDAIHNTNALLASRGTLSSGAAIDSRAIMAFDISPYAGLTLSSATLSGFGGRVDNSFLPDPITAHFFDYAGDGSVTLADFDRAATATGNVTLPGVTDFSLTLSPFSLPVGATVQPLLSAGNPYVEFRVEADQLTALINAGEAAAPFQTDSRYPGPRLTLEFAPQSSPVVPEPPSLWLVSLALGTAVCCLRKSTSLDKQ